MARKRMVTRTIKTNEVTVLCLNIVTAELTNETFVVPCNLKDESAMLKYIKKNFDTDTCKAVSVSNITTKEAYYGMEEQDFIKHAQIITKDEAENAEN